MTSYFSKCRKEKAENGDSVKDGCFFVLTHSVSHSGRLFLLIVENSLQILTVRILLSFLFLDLLQIKNYLPFQSLNAYFYDKLKLKI